MKVLDGLKYSKSHEWVKDLGDGCILMGLTDYAQDQLGELVYINLPEEGDSVTAGETFADVESVKAVTDVFSAVSGKVAEVNEDLLDNPQKVNEDPYGAWLVRISDVSESEELLDGAAYQALCDSQAD